MKETKIIIVQSLLSFIEFRNNFHLKETMSGVNQINLNPSHGEPPSVAGEKFLSPDAFKKVKKWELSLFQAN